MQLTLPYPPSANHYWRHVVIGRRASTLLSKEAREFRANVIAAVGVTPPQLTGRLGVCIAVYPPDRRRRDIDNIQKPLLDALGHAGIYADDSQIDRLETTRERCVAGGKVEVTVTEL